VVVFAPWMVRNVAWVGNPVFPEGMEVLGRGHFSEAQVVRWRVAHSPTALERSVAGRLGAAWERIGGDWRFGFGFLPLVVVAVALARDWRAGFLAVLLGVQLVVWLGFTHLQGRFFVLAVPIGAVAIGGMGRARGWPVVAGCVIGVMAVVGFVIQNNRYSLVRELAANSLLGVEDLRWAVELRSGIDLARLPEDRPIVLVGDAQAFFYSGIPMSRLRYRTVFDVPPAVGEDWLGAWTAGALEGTVVVFPDELLRFKRTYFGVPTPPEGELRGQKPYVLTRPQ
jgi:hypothetical protein